MNSIFCLKSVCFTFRSSNVAMIYRLIYSGFLHDLRFSFDVITKLMHLTSSILCIQAQFQLTRWSLFLFFDSFFFRMMLLLLLSTLWSERINSAQIHRQ